MDTVSYGEFSQTFHARTMERHLPLSGTIEVTRRCPLTCVHCYNNLPMADREASSTELTLRGALPHPRRAGRCRLPLAVVHRRRDLRPPRLPRHLHLREAKGFLITLFTNGTLITPRIADYLAAWRPFAIEITLVRPDEGHVRAADRDPGIVREVPARHPAAARTQAAARAEIGGRHDQRARAPRHAGVRRRARRRVQVRRHDESAHRLLAEPARGPADARRLRGARSRGPSGASTSGS